MRRRALLALGAAAALPRLVTAAAAAGGVAAAGAWPERPIRLIVPVAPGGSQDIVARLLARALAPALGVPVLVENMAGAGSNIGYEAAARARPDGHTLLAGSDSLSINQALFPGLRFDPVEDFAPIGRAVLVPQIFVVRAESAVGDLAGFVGQARRVPLAVGTPGNGSLAHLLGEVVQQAAETRWTHVPYRGGALAVNDLLGGTLDGVLINIGAVAEHVRGGRLRGLFVSSAGRTLGLPEVPSLAEAGLPGLEAVGWHGLVAPAGTDTAICHRLHAEMRRALATPEVAGRIAGLGMEPGTETPEELGALIRADAARWAAVVRRAGLRPD